MFAESLLIQSSVLLDKARELKMTLATAESCTGGLVSGVLTEIPGSSDVMERGFVTYTNRAKHELLRVGTDILENPGAVSAEVAEAMARGVLAHSPADVAVSVTGIAGPGGATEFKPVGLVWFGLATRRGHVETEQHVFDGDRNAIRQAAVQNALNFFSKGLDLAAR